MTQQEWDAFEQFRNSFKTQINTWNSLANQLIPLQMQASQWDGRGSWQPTPPPPTFPSVPPAILTECLKRRGNS